MRRRTLLGAVAGGLAATAGCVTDGGRDPGGSADPGDPVNTDRPDGTPDPDDRDTFSSVGCPSFGDAERTVCHRERGDADVALVPSAYTFEEYDGDEEVETLGLAVDNDGDRTFEFDPHGWAVFRYDDADDWVAVARGPPVEPVTSVPPGDRYRYSLATEEHPAPSDGGRAVTADLRSGDTHAFRVAGRFEGAPDRVELVAVFDYVRAVP